MNMVLQLSKVQPTLFFDNKLADDDTTSSKSGQKYPGVETQAHHFNHDNVELTSGMKLKNAHTACMDAKYQLQNTIGIACDPLWAAIRFMEDSGYRSKNDPRFDQNVLFNKIKPKYDVVFLSLDCEFKNWSSLSGGYAN